MIDYCIEKARQSDSGGRVTVYAVATDKRGRILAEGHNLYTKSHTIQALYAKRVGLPNKQFLHAEIKVLTHALKSSIMPSRLYIARVGRNGEALPALPCKICALYIETEFPNLEVETT